MYTVILHTMKEYRKHFLLEKPLSPMSLSPKKDPLPKKPLSKKAPLSNKLLSLINPLSQKSPPTKKGLFLR